MKPTLRTFFLIALSIIIFQSCQKGLPHIQPLKVTSLSATSGGYGTSVTINGTGFSVVKANNQVYFNGVLAVISAVTDTTITTTVPVSAGTGPVTVSVNSSTPIVGPVFTYQLTAQVTTLAGSATVGATSGPAASSTFGQLWGIVLDSKGNIFTSEFLQPIIRELSQGTVSLFAGKLNNNNVDLDGTGTAASFDRPWEIAIDANDNMYVAQNDRVRKITPAAVVTSILIPGATNINSIALDASGNIFTGDQQQNIIYKTTPAGVTSVFAGSGTLASVDGTGTAASFYHPFGMTIDKSGNLYVVDQTTSVIRKITPAAVVTTFAGNGLRGFADGVGTAASFNMPTGLTFDAAGNLYVADTFNNKIRKVTPNGTVTTVAGLGAQSSIDGTASVATFSQPRGVVLDATGNIYVTEYSEIRRINFQ